MNFFKLNNKRRTYMHTDARTHAHKHTPIHTRTHRCVLVKITNILIKITNYLEKFSKDSILNKLWVNKNKG